MPARGSRNVVLRSLGNGRGSSSSVSLGHVTSRVHGTLLACVAMSVGNGSSTSFVERCVTGTGRASVAGCLEFISCGAPEMGTSVSFRRLLYSGVDSSVFSRR